MKTKIYMLLALGCLNFTPISAQDNNQSVYSETRKFIENAETTRVNKDWSLIAEFRSGIGETVEFFPIQIVNLKTGEKRNSLQVNVQVKTKGGGLGATLLGIGAAGVAGGLASGNAAQSSEGSIIMAQAMRKDGLIELYVDNSEVEELIKFMEINIIPNLNTKYKDKSSEFIFIADELTFKFLIHEKRKRLSILVNDAETYEFWTESNADRIDELLPTLKKVNSKELEF